MTTLRTSKRHKGTSTTQPKKHLHPNALCNILAKKRKAFLKDKHGVDDMLLESPIPKKRSALRKFAALARVVINSPPTLSTRAATRRMVDSPPNRTMIDSPPAFSTRAATRRIVDSLPNRVMTDSPPIHTTRAETHHMVGSPPALSTRVRRSLSNEVEEILETTKLAEPEEVDEMELEEIVKEMGEVEAEEMAEVEPVEVNKVDQNISTSPTTRQQK